MSWIPDFKWQAKFASNIRRIVGPHLLVVADMELDQSEATDFLVFHAAGLRLAARLRRPGRGYAEKWGHQVTFRSKRDSGARTEWAKVIEDGFGDWMFYGHVGKHNLKINPWWLIDLHVLRRLYGIHGMDVVDNKDVDNRDGTWFHALSVPRLVNQYDASDLTVAWCYDGTFDPQTEFIWNMT